MSPLPLFEIDLPEGFARLVSGANIALAFVGLMVLAMRANRLDRGRFWLCPFAWSYTLAGQATLGVGLLTVIVAAHGDSVDMRRIAIFLTTLGAVMVLTRSRRSSGK